MPQNTKTHIEDIRKIGLPPGTLKHVGKKSVDKVKISIIDYLNEQFQELEIDKISDSFDFKESAKEYDLPWELIAAIGFQESHWDPNAQSPTGVRGIMMMTEETAEHMGISDRTDPEQSIWGGAKFLKYLMKSQPQNMHLREKILLALASYNVGPGHLSDAQKLVLNDGDNPHSWRDVKESLPLLSLPHIALQSKFGLARGNEPVHFTERVISYFEFLTIAR